MDRWLPDWVGAVTPEQTVRLHGWAGRAFALCIGSDGVVVARAEGRQRHPGLHAALATLTEGECAATGWTVEDGAAVDALAAAAVAFERGERPDVAPLRQWLDAHPTAPVGAPRVRDVSAFRAAACREARSALIALDRRAAVGHLALVLAEPDRSADADPVFGFFTDATADSVSRALTALTGAPVASQDLPPASPGWHVLPLPSPRPHPAGVLVDRVPIPGRDRWAGEVGWEAPTTRLVSRVRRLKRIVDLGAPEPMVATELSMVDEALAAFVDVPAAPPERPRSTLPDWHPLPLGRPPVGPAQGVFRVPFHGPARILVQRPDRMVVFGAEDVLHTLPPCPWKPLFASSRYVAFGGELRSGETPLAVAVLDLEQGRWLERWPDHPGVQSLHSCWLAEHGEPGNSWVLDPRLPRAWGTPGPTLAWQTEGGRALLLHTPEGLVRCAPAPRGLELQPVVLDRGDPWFRIDVQTGRVRTDASEPWELQAEPLAALSQTVVGRLLIAWHGVLHLDGEALIGLEGPVLDVSIEGGNGTSNGDLAVLTSDAVRVFGFQGSSEEQDATVELIAHFEV